MIRAERNSEAPLVCVVLVNWNRWRDTVACLESCAGLDYPHLHIIVVDNGSRDDSANHLRSRFPALHLIEMGANLGFAGGNNVGIHTALAMGAEYVWLLNNDTIVDPETLRALVEVMERDPTVGIAGSRISYLDNPGTLWFAGGFFVRPWGWVAHRGDCIVDAGQYDSLAESDFVTGCSLLARTSVVRSIGPLDERYFLFWEDVDWSVRARRAGWRIVYVPGSRVLHKLGGSIPAMGTSLRWRYEGRNRLLFYRKLQPTAIPRIAVGTLLNVCYLVARGRPRAGLSLLRGLIDGACGRSGPMRS